MDVAWTLLPNALSAALVYTSGTRGGACPRTPWQPPGWVFGVVWPILYLALGVAMARLARRRSDALRWTVALMIALNAWWLIFGIKCRPQAALVSIAAVLALAIWTAYRSYQEDQTAGLLLTPLLAWLAFATALSVRLLWE